MEPKKSAESSEFASVRDATSATMPRHIWVHHVQLEASRRARARGLGDEIGSMLREAEIRARIHRAYNAGEAIWMMVDELALRVRAWRDAQRSESVQEMSVNSFLRTIRRMGW